MERQIFAAWQLELFYGSQQVCKIVKEDDFHCHLHGPQLWYTVNQSRMKMHLKLRWRYNLLHKAFPKKMQYKVLRKI